MTKAMKGVLVDEVFRFGVVGVVSFALVALQQTIFKGVSGDCSHHQR